MQKQKIMAFVMAGGEGTRLYPLTKARSKPSVPFGGRYRLVDFVLSNLINSEIYGIYLLVQYKSQALIEHVRKTWPISSVLPQQFITIVPPQMLHGASWFQGTADAVHQNINLIEQFGPDLVAVFGADHVYRMDIRQMVSFHVERQADITVAALPVPLGEASAFGVIAVDAESRICDFQEKPDSPVAMPGDPEHAYASMGNYLFSAEVLLDALREAHQRGESDFGKHVLPRLLHSRRMYAYNFAANSVPGAKAYEEVGYWRDLGNIDSYYAAHQDVLGLRPRMDVFNPQWPIHSSNYQGTVAKIISGHITNSILAGGTVVHGAEVKNSVVRREVILEEDVLIEDCVIMDYVRIQRGARLRRAIVDRYNVIEAGARIGYDLDADRQRYHVTPSGIVVVPEGKRGGHLDSFIDEHG
jgi:glucose-1-phosphate adenylyltransferase